MPTCAGHAVHQVIVVSSEVIDEPRITDRHRRVIGNTAINQSNVCRSIRHAGEDSVQDFNYVRIGGSDGCERAYVQSCATRIMTDDLHEANSTARDRRSRQSFKKLKQSILKTAAGRGGVSVEGPR